MERGVHAASMPGAKTVVNFQRRFVLNVEAG
jgi:hypothetical protein